MFGSNPQKTGLNSSQYDFKGVAVISYSNVGETSSKLL